ncbi:hypothetical protein GGI07_000805 [Coemansia sp. Benny D115]|nr:hypothetical protein GGI07_000805 [Coemansia sp. Benny D115]
MTRVPREGNLSETQAVTDPASTWRAFACMVPFTASDNTPLIMLYGGTDDSSAHNPLDVASKGMNKLQVFDTKNNKWYAPPTANAPKTGPVLPGCGAASGNIWVYDPQYSIPKKASTAVSLLDSVHWSWSAPTEQGQLPVTRFGAAFSYVPSSSSFYMHGGIPLKDDTNTADNPPGIANNVDILSPSTISWTYASNGPARKYHTLCYMSSIDALILFGGSDMDIESYNDIKVLKVKNNLWQYSVKITGDPPAERLLHSAVCTEDTMYVFGGLHSINDDPSDSSVWVLKASGEAEFAWSKAPINTSGTQSTGPTARAGHSAALYNNNMYIYGGVGPSGQDATMYKLDLGSWTWSQTNSSGGSGVEGQKEKKAKTAVLIASIVSSVLGVITIGIAATVIYRLIRRWRGQAFGGVAGRRHSSGADSDASSNNSDMNGDIAAVSESKNDHLGRRGTDASYYQDDSHHNKYADAPPDSGTADMTHPSPAFIGPSSNRSSIVAFGLPLIPAIGDNHRHPIESGESSNTARTPAEEGLATDSLNCESPETAPESISTERELLSSKESGGLYTQPTASASVSASASAGANRGVFNSMRAHARSISSRIVPSRVSIAFSDSTVAVPHLPPNSPLSTGASVRASNRKGRADTNGSSTSVARRDRKSTIIDQHTAADMYGRDYSRLENEYRQAEAINQILLSGQPIPTWLRDAVNQAQQDEHHTQAQDSGNEGLESSGTPLPSSSSLSTPNLGTRKLGIANKPDNGP